MHAFNTGTHNTEAGRTEAQGHPWLHNKFKVSVGYTRPTRLKKKLSYKIHKFQETNIQLSDCILYLKLVPIDFKFYQHPKNIW